MHSFTFKVTAECPDSDARLGIISLPHGIIETPAFMPVGSQATIKTMTPADLDEIGVQIILTNAYHLYLRPGVDVIASAGGIHKFMSWNKPILTDSGGYQLFSLARLTRVDDSGVLFRSHIDGSEHFLTPERAVQVQESLGADIIMVLDECAPYNRDTSYIKPALFRTHLWAKRCLNVINQDTALFGIVQGGTYKELRKESADFLSSLPFHGYAIGGLSIGEPKELTWEMTEFTSGLLPRHKPRYLMGVGSPEDLVTAVALGIDLFDSALPTRVGRNGGLLTRQGRVNIRNAKFARQDTPLDAKCACYTCRNFSAAYLHHLFRCEELLAYRLATYHNLFYIIHLMKDIREAIEAGNFLTFKNHFLSEYSITEEAVRLEQKNKWLRRQG